MTQRKFAATEPHPAGRRTGRSPQPDNSSGQYSCKNQQSTWHV